MRASTVTVEFEDAQLSIDRVVSALNDAGYSVPRYSKTP